MPFSCGALVARAGVEGHQHRQRPRAGQLDAVDRQPVRGHRARAHVRHVLHPRTFYARASARAATTLPRRSRRSRQPLTARARAAAAGRCSSSACGSVGTPKTCPASCAARSSPTRRRSVVDEAIERIAHDYYRPIPASKLADASIAGVVASLGDRFSHYLTPERIPRIRFAAALHGHRRRCRTAVRHARAADRARVQLLARRARGAEGGRRDRRASTVASSTGLSAEAATGADQGPAGHRRPARHRGAACGAASTRHAAHASSSPAPSSPSRSSNPTTKTVHGVKLGVVALASFSPGAHVEVREAVEHVLHAGARGHRASTCAATAAGSSRKRS